MAKVSAPAVKEEKVEKAKSDKEIYGRSMSMKETVLLKNPKIIRRKRSRGTGFAYQAEGLDPKGNVTYAMIGEVHAMACIKSKYAVKHPEKWAE